MADLVTQVRSLPRDRRLAVPPGRLRPPDPSNSAAAVEAITSNAERGSNGLPAVFPRLRSRRDLSERLGGSDLQALLGASGPVAARVRAVAGKKPLLPLFEVRTRRRTFFLKIEAFAARRDHARRDRDPTRTAGDRRLPSPPPSGDRSPVPNAPGARTVRSRAARRMRAATRRPEQVRRRASVLDLRPSAPERFGANRHRHRDVQRGGRSRAFCGSSSPAMSQRRPGTRLGDDVEELHEMRVATRRLRAALSLFADVLPETALKAREEIGWVGQGLGAVRDLDVQIEQLDGWLDTAEPEDRQALAILRSLLQAQRETARTAMLELLDSRRYEAFVNRFSRTLRARHLARSGPAAQPALALAPELIETRFRSVRKAAKRSGPDSPATDYHRLENPHQAPPLRARVPRRPVPGQHAGGDQEARRRPGPARTAPGRRRRDRSSAPARAFRRRGARPENDLRTGRNRPAPPARRDPATSTGPHRLRPPLQQAMEDLPQGARGQAPRAPP